MTYEAYTRARDVLVESRSRLDGQRVFVELLRDHRLWSRVSRALRQKALQAVEKSLGGAFECLGESSKEGHAVFRYRLGRSTKAWKNWGRSFSAFRMDFVLIPGGPYKVSPKPSCAKTISFAPFLLARKPLSQRAWDLHAKEDGRLVSDARAAIHGVSWLAAREWLLEEDLRLPSEGEWQCFCALLGEQENAWGLSAGHGVAWEWCRDEYQDLPGGLSWTADPLGDVSGYDRGEGVLRKVCEKVSDYERPKALRRSLSRDEMEAKVGFRMAKSLITY